MKFKVVFGFWFVIRLLSMTMWFFMKVLFLICWLKVG